MGLVVLTEIEARSDALPLRRQLDALQPAVVELCFGQSSLGRSVLALPALAGVTARFPAARLVVSGRPSVRDVLKMHLQQTGSVVTDTESADLVIDFSPRAKHEARLLDGPPPRLWIPHMPYPARVQHGFRHFSDGARSAGLEPPVAAPRLRLSAEARSRARAVAQRLAPGGPLVLIAARRGGWPASFFAEACRDLEQRIGSRAANLGTHPVEGVPRLRESAVVRASLFELASVVIADARGVAHLAAACGAAVASLHGRACPARHAPAARLSAALYSKCRAPKTHRPSPARDQRCPRCLLPSTVVTAAERLAARRWPWDRVARTPLGAHFR